MFTLTFDGGDELAQALDRLSMPLQKKIVRDALYEGGEAIRATASRLAPYEPGPPDLRDNIGMSSAKPFEGDVATIKVGPTRGFAYGLPQEFGTRHHAAHPFMRPAFDREAPRALGVIGKALWRELAARGISRRASVSVPVSGPGRLT